jgi:4-hydroxy-tetrahydrodipicolinate reductase
MPTRIAIAGMNGRMGREVAAATAADEEIVLVGGVVRAGSLGSAADGTSGRVVEHVEEIVDECDVLIDFTAPDATLCFARACAAAGRAFVTGTTGLSAAQDDELRTLGAAIPVFVARNMSVGLNAVLAILPALVCALDGYDIEIVETHHRHKRDAPSGTALALTEAIAAARETPRSQPPSRLLAERAVYGRQGVAPRTAGEIGIHAVRAGGNAGEHRVLFADEGEEIVVTHRAFSRRTFALGALRAAKFLVRQPVGSYAMEHLIAWHNPLHSRLR